MTGKMSGGGGGSGEGGRVCMYVCLLSFLPAKIISDDSAQWLHMLGSKVLLI